jgi:PKD repeat protein
LIEPEQILSDFIINTDSIFADSLCYFQNLSTGGSYHNWNFGDGSNSNEINPSHSFSNPGFYLTTLKVSNDSSQTCSSESLSIVEVNGLTSSRLIKQSSNFSILQSNDYIFISSENHNLINSIKVFDSKGKLVFTKRNINSNNTKINKVNFKAGIYIIILDSKGKNYSSKIVINN